MLDVSYHGYTVLDAGQVSSTVQDSTERSIHRCGSGKNVEWGRRKTNNLVDTLEASNEKTSQRFHRQWWMYRICTVYTCIYVMHISEVVLGRVNHHITNYGLINTYLCMVADAWTNRARCICTKCFADHCISFGNEYDVEESWIQLFSPPHFLALFAYNFSPLL